MDGADLISRKYGGRFSEGEGEDGGPRRDRGRGQPGATARAGEPLVLFDREAEFFEIAERLFKSGDHQEGTSASEMLSRARRLVFFVLCEDCDNFRRHALYGLAGAEHVRIAFEPY